MRQTSINCYHQIKAEGLLSKRRFEVYEAIYRNAPCTTNEALRNIFSGSHGVGSRTTELRDLGVIYERCVRECKVTGRNVIEWDLTDKLPVKSEKKLSGKERRKFDALTALRNYWRDNKNANVDELTNIANLIKKI